MVNLTNLQNELHRRLKAQSEWLLIGSSGKALTFRNAEIELEFSRNRLLFGFLDHKGFQTWRINDYKFEKGEIRLNLSRNFGRETEIIKLIPRVSTGELGAELELARAEKANQIARLIEEDFPNTKLLRVQLNKENGRFAQILFETRGGRQIAALADVTETLTPEFLLSTAILWLSRLAHRKKNPVGKIWILGAKKQAGKVRKLHALLRPDWQSRIFIKEVLPSECKAQGDGRRPKEKNLIELPAPGISDLWRTRPKPLKLAENAQMSRSAQKIISLAPDEIDAVRSQNGETLRYLGLPFARVRKIFETEKVWFGVERNRPILTADNEKNLLEIIENLRNYRRFDSPNKRHAFYHLAAEAWLETVLRKNIKLLDANLILSPVYRQFRAERGRIDLFALRRDRRLVIIELKVVPDREMIFQGADYWRKIELQRRAGNLQKARLFGELEIADRPSLVYLVAPALCFHREFDFLARTVSPEIEIACFKINENWRESLKVMSRLLLEEIKITNFL
jgi:hypothetical protein